MTFTIIAAIFSFLWWIGVGIYRNMGWGNGCAVTTAWGTIPVWSLWLGGAGVIFGLTIAVLEVAIGGRRFGDTFGAWLATSALAGFLTALIGYNLPRLFINYTSCPIPGGAP